MGFSPGPSDPFYALMKPPPDETPAQATARLKREQDAQQTSDEIDEAIKKDRAAAKKEKGIIRLLLIGQAESGKSTVLKNFRMRCARAEWERERNGWRAVVQLNVVRSLTMILRVIEEELSGFDPTESEDDLVNSNADTANPPVRFTDRHQLLTIRLAPLLRVEAELKRRLGSGAEEVQPSAPQVATPFDDPQGIENIRRRMPEFTVRSWKEVLERPHGAYVSSSSSAYPDDVTRTLAECKDDMKALWQDKPVRQVLRRRRLHLLDSPGFFLNDLDRVAALDYTVTDDDIVRARLRTAGIQEYRLFLPRGPFNIPRSVKEPAWEWRIFDVGGCRTLRAAWLPYFEDVLNVIIFLSPVSVFDQRLEEDPSVNRLEDSILLWTSICQSKLLSKTQLILFLNKCDLLGRKLKRGVRVSQYLTSYGDRPNEVIPVVKYLREKFKDIQRQHSPVPRPIYIYHTTATDTTATAITLESGKCLIPALDFLSQPFTRYATVFCEKTSPTHN